MSSMEVVRMRKAELVLRIATQRLSLASQMSELQPLMRKADTGLRAVKVVATAWPWLCLFGALAGARLLRKSNRPRTRSHAPRAASLWLQRGLVAWRAWTWARQALSYASYASSARGMPANGRRAWPWDRLARPHT
jgi:hypothetical protein